MLISELAKSINAEIYISNSVKEQDFVIDNIASIMNAKAHDITFVTSTTYENLLNQTHAGAVILANKLPNMPFIQLIHPNPYLAYAKAAQLIYAHKQHRQYGISKNAHIDRSSFIHASAYISSFCYIDANSYIDEYTQVLSNTHIGKNVKIGKNCLIYPNVVIYDDTIIGNNVIIHAGAIIGNDGFGFAKDSNNIPVKIPQIGNVIIEDNVEIGACCTIARAALDHTIIRKNTKLDAHIHVAHNCDIGENCMFAAFVGIAGSTTIGNNVLIGGHAGINGHIKICDNVMIGAKAGIIGSIKESGTYMGFPALKANEWKRIQIYLKKLSEYEKRLKDLELRFNTLNIDKGIKNG